MALQQFESDGGPSPLVLQEWHYDEIVDFLSRDVPGNLFQLCWLENHGVRPISQPDLFCFRGWLDPDRHLHAVSLLITDRLALLEAADAEDARRVGRWYREFDLDIDHVVSKAECVEPFWQAYSGADYADSRLHRRQVMYQLEPDGWLDRRNDSLESTDVRYAEPGDIDALFLASARMHREETLQDPLEHDPDGFRKHVRHRIESNRSFVWFDDRQQLVFKADLSARGSFGVQISGVFTSPTHRGRGIATRALADICQHLFDEGVPRIVLYVNCENRAARRVYSKVGFSRHTDYQTVFVAD